VSDSDLVVRKVNQMRKKHKSSKQYVNLSNQRVALVLLDY